MGMNDQNNDSPQKPRDVELTNDSLMNGENGGRPQPQQNRGGPSGQHRPKRRVARRKIRVELIKEPAIDARGELIDAVTAEEAAFAAEAASSPAPAPTTAPTALENQQRPPALSGSDNRLHINDLTQMSMPELRDKATKMGVNHEALISMKKQEIIFADPEGAHGEGRSDLCLRRPGDPPGRLRLSPLAQLQLPARARRHLHLPVPDPSVQPEDRRHGGGADPIAQGRGALLRHAAGRDVNFDAPLVAQTRIPFDNLTPLYPDEKLNLETDDGGDLHPHASTCSAPSARASAG